MKPARVLFFCSVVFFLLTHAGQSVQGQKTFVLTPGNSPAKMLNEVRQWRNASSSNATVKVQIDVRPGTYTLEEPLVFGPRDGHMDWKGSGDVLFTRGKTITGWKKNAQGRFVTMIPEVASGKWWFEQLFVNGRRGTPAKTPNEFYYFIEDQVDCISDPTTGKFVDTSRRAFIPRKEQRNLFKQIADAISKGRPVNDIRIKFYHSWETSLHRLASYTTKTNTVLLTGDAKWTLTYWNRGGLRYQIEGIPEALDAPGEFLLERNGRLTYIPRDGETLERLNVVAPFGPSDGDDSAILRISGDVDKLAACENNKPINTTALIDKLTFSGITFAHAPFVLPLEGMSSNQSAVLSPAAILVEAARNVNFIRCNVEHVGGYGIWFHRGCRDCRVEQCLFEDLGAGGIRIGTHLRTIAISNDHLTSGHVLITDNIIRGYGGVDGGGIGIWIGSADNNRVFHNEVCDGLYTGISIGWVWGYSPSRSFNNKIEFNHIHHIGQGVLSDMGAVYTLGISPGTTVSNNVIHDVRSYNHYGGGGLGLYTDEGSSHILFENNLIYNTHTAVIHQHYGRENIFRNNIIAFPFQRGAISRSRMEKHLSYTAERNIILCDRTPFFTGNWKDKEHFALRNNLYCLMKADDWNDDTQGRLFNNQTFDEWKAQGNDAGSIIADPGFVDARKYDFRFAGKTINEAVRRIGFKPFDISLAGLTPPTKQYFAKRFTEYVCPDAVLAPEPPGPVEITLQDDFESPRVKLIRNARYTVPEPPILRWKLKISDLNANSSGNLIYESDQIPCENSHWNRFNWLGFCSSGNEKATIDLANISVRSQQADGTPFVFEENFKRDLIPHGKRGSFNPIPKTNDGIWSLKTDPDGKRFLRMTDSETVTPVFNPHVYYIFNEPTGKIQTSFDFRVSERAKLSVMVREYPQGDQYRNGPAMTIDKGQLKLGENKPCKIQSGRWYRAQIECKADDAAGKPFEVVAEGTNHFLRINDDPRYFYSFDPHFNYLPAMSTGTVHVNFRVRMGKGARFSMEGRTSGGHYEVGPSIQFTESEVKIAKKTIAHYNNDEWMKVNIKFCPNQHHWTLSIRRLNAKAGKEELVVDREVFPFGSRKFNSLQWLGFIAYSREKATIDLDDISITPQETAQ